MFWAKKKTRIPGRGRYLNEGSKRGSCLDTGVYMIPFSSQGKGEEVQRKLKLDVAHQDSMTFRSNPTLHLRPCWKQPGFCLSFPDVFCTGKVLRGFENQPVRTCLQKLREVN